jgi:hypothetical protein
MWDLLRGAGQTCRALHEASSRALVRRVDTHVLDRMDLSPFDGWSLADITLYTLLDLTPRPMESRWGLVHVPFEKKVLPWRTPEMRQKLTPEAASLFLKDALYHVTRRMTHFITEALKDTGGPFSLSLDEFFVIGRDARDYFDDVFLRGSREVLREHDAHIHEGLRKVRSLQSGSFCYGNDVAFDSDSEGERLHAEYDDAWDGLHCALQDALYFLFLKVEDWGLAATLRSQGEQGTWCISLGTGLVKKKQA